MVGFYPDLDLARKHFYQSVIQFSGRSEGVVYTILLEMIDVVGPIVSNIHLFET